MKAAFATSGKMGRLELLCTAGLLMLNDEERRVLRETQVQYGSPANVADAMWSTDSAAIPTPLQDAAGDVWLKPELSVLINAYPTIVIRGIFVHRSKPTTIEVARLFRMGICDPIDARLGAGYSPAVCLVDKGTAYNTEIFTGMLSRIETATLQAYKAMPWAKPHVEGTNATLKRRFLPNLSMHTGEAVVTDHALLETFSLSAYIAAAKRATTCSDDRLRDYLKSRACFGVPAKDNAFFEKNFWLEVIGTYKEGEFRLPSGESYSSPDLNGLTPGKRFQARRTVDPCDDKVTIMADGEPIAIAARSNFAPGVNPLVYNYVSE